MLKGVESCADPESFVRGSPTQTFFLCFFFFFLGGGGGGGRFCFFLFFFKVDEGRVDPNTTKTGNHRTAINAGLLAL